MNESHCILHVFNGDCAADAWKKNTLSAECYIVWRENYLEGPLPAVGTPQKEFARIRAEYLHTCVPQYSVETLTRFQCTLEDTILSRGPEDVIMLWFDDCMFDILLLSRILFLLEKSSAELRLCCENRVLGNETDLFRTPWSEFRKFAPETIRLFADTWRTLTLGGAAPEQLLQSGRMDHEEALKRAVQRYLADHPQDHSLGLSERKLLKLIADGTSRFTQLFQAFNASEERPFMGDTMCERLLQSLENRGFLTRETDAENRVFYHLASRTAENVSRNRKRDHPRAPKP